ncbi:MAG: hypothetical protein RLZZ230_136 [Candidatus Parcubacteria bacterium]|jgi:hypothetical protein
MQKNIKILIILFTSLSLALIFYLTAKEPSPSSPTEPRQAYFFEDQIIDIAGHPNKEVDSTVITTENTEIVTSEETEKLFNFSSSTEQWAERIKFTENSPSNDIVATVIISEHPRTGAEIIASADRKPVVTIERIDIYTPQTGTTTIADTSFDELGVSNYFRPLFSPDGAFLYVTTRHYEGESSFYFERQTGKVNRIDPIVFQGDWEDRELKILWSPDATKMVVRSTGSAIGYGHRAIYYSKTGKPTDLEVILDFDKSEREAQENNSVSLLDIFDTSVTNEQFNFTALYSDESLVKSSYIFKTGEILNLE